MIYFIFSWFGNEYFGYIKFLMWIPFYNSIFQLIYFKDNIRKINKISIIMAAFILFIITFMVNALIDNGVIEVFKMILNPFTFLLRP